MINHLRPVTLGATASSGLPRQAGCTTSPTSIRPLSELRYHQTMKQINPIILPIFLGALLVGCSSDTSSGGGSSITLNRGGGEERAAASAETSTSSSGTTSTASTGVYEAYVDRYPDLLVHYTASGGGQTKSAFGQTHYCAFGKSEGRTIDASVYCTTPTTTTSTGSTTSASTSSTTVSYKSLGPTGTVWKPKSEKDHKLVILTPNSWRAMAISIRQMDGTLIETGSSCKRTNGNRCTYRFGKAGGAYPKPCILRIGTTNYRIANGAQRIN